MKGLNLAAAKIISVPCLFSASPFVMLTGPSAMTWCHARTARMGSPMKVMVIGKATNESEAGVIPSAELMEAMGKYNEELIKAGILLAAEGLKPSSAAVRVHYDGINRTVTDGPFAETKELIAGFMLWQVCSMEEAVEWVKKSPMPGEVDIRPLFEIEDFAEWDTNGKFAAGLQTRRDQVADKS